MNSDCLGVIIDQLGIKELSQLGQVNRRLSSLVKLKKGYLNTMKHFALIKEGNNRFIWLCQNGYLRLAQHYFRDYPSVNLHAYQESAFRFSCEKGHLEVVKDTARCV